MNNRNFFEYTFDFLNDNENTHLKHFDLLLDAILSLLVNRIDEKQTSFSEERLYFINLVSHKFILHGFAIKEIIDGVHLESKSKDFKIKVTDPFSVYSLIRTLIETYLVQNYLSNRKIHKDILQGRFEIWMRYGLKQRRINAETEEEKAVLEKDKTSIEHFENRIKEKSFYKILSDEKKSELSQNN